MSFGVFLNYLWYQTGGILTIKGRALLCQELYLRAIFHGYS